MRAKKTYICLAALIPFLLVALLYEILPLIMVMINSFQPDQGSGFTLGNYTTVFTKLIYQKAIINSIKISVTSAVIGILIAFIGAKAVDDCRGRMSYFFTTVLNMVSNFAGVPLAFAYMILLGNAGWMVHVGQRLGLEGLANYNLYTSGGMSLIYVYFQIPLATLLLIPAFDGIRKEWQEANALLGGSGVGFWWHVGLPVLMPSIMGTFSVLFANALAAYATVYALMMNNISLLPIQIAGSYVGEIQIRKGLGGALSVVMMILMVCMILITNRISRIYEPTSRKRGECA